MFDLGSTHNFISIELAQKLGIQTEEMGLAALEAHGAFKGKEVLVTPLIKKLRLHVQSYMDQEDFYISSLSFQDVILGVPFLHCMATKLKFPSHLIAFTFRNRVIAAKDRGSTIPIVSHTGIQKSIKKFFFAYLIFATVPVSFDKAQESDEITDQQLNFLKEHKDCFVDSIPKELPPFKGVDDH